jgi:hypothetical protein
MLSVKRDSLTSSFRICIPFISSSCLIALTRNSKTMLNWSGESWEPFSHSWLLGKWFQFFSIKYDVVYSLSYIAFIMLRYIPSIPSFIRAFVMKGFWILSKAFSASIDMTKCFLSLFLLILYITFINFHMLNHLCIPGWSWLGHGAWSFSYAVGFGLPLFY